MTNPPPPPVSKPKNGALDMVGNVGLKVCGRCLIHDAKGYWRNLDREVPTPDLSGRNTGNGMLPEHRSGPLITLTPVDCGAKPRRLLVPCRGFKITDPVSNLGESTRWFWVALPNWNNELLT